MKYDNMVFVILTYMLYFCMIYVIIIINITMRYHRDMQTMLMVVIPINIQCEFFMYVCMNAYECNYKLMLLCIRFI